MTVTYTLLAANLGLLSLCLLRSTPRPLARRSDIDAFLRREVMVRGMRPLPDPALVSGRPVVVPFRSRRELKVEHARRLHPSSLEG